MTGESPDEIARAIEQVYRDGSLWQRLRDAALHRIVEDCAPEVFREQIRRTLVPCLNSAPRTGSTNAAGVR
jgi:hypothetical protein